MEIATKGKLKERPPNSHTVNLQGMDLQGMHMLIAYRQTMLCLSQFADSSIWPAVSIYVIGIVIVSCFKHPVLKVYLILMEYIELHKCRGKLYACQNQLYIQTTR